MAEAARPAPGSWVPIRLKTVYDPSRADPSGILTKHLAASDDDSERVFLADNDTVYLTDLAPLAQIPPEYVAGALADLRRITPELWTQLQSDVNIQVIPLEWIPWKERALAEREARDPEWERYAYFNGGAILLPPGGNFWRLWERETERLSAYFKSRGMNDRKDAGSDQLSLTSAAAKHGAWQLLPAGFNVRPFHFWTREPPLEKVAHFHLIGAKTVLRSMSPEGPLPLSIFLRRYWETMLFAEVHPDKRSLAASLLDEVLTLVADFDLDDVHGSATLS